MARSKKKQQRKRLTKLERKAYHEAGHALIAYINRVPFKSVTITEGSPSLGEVWFESRLNHGAQEMTERRIANWVMAAHGGVTVAGGDCMVGHRHRLPADSPLLTPGFPIGRAQQCRRRIIFTRFRVGCTHALCRVLSTYTVVACLIAGGQGESRRLPEINELMRLHEFRDYQEEDYHDRIEIIRKVIERNTEKLENHWEGGELEKVKEKLQTIQFLCEYAGRESDQEQDSKELRDKEVKKLEIVARKLSAYLEDLKRTLPFPEHALFNSTIGVLEQLRRQLLEQLFGDP